MKDALKGGILGLIVGDALGVPVEFVSREELSADPVTDMRAYGSHNQPKGTWSDDSSMTLCLMESLGHGVDYLDLSRCHLAWAEEGYLTPHGHMFDIGRTTLTAIMQFARGTAPLDCGQTGEFDNGNGSLMRILPLVFYGATMPLEERMTLVHEISQLTHAHPRCQMACGLYVAFALALYQGQSREEAYGAMVKLGHAYYENHPEKHHFSRILDGLMGELPIHDIRSTSYVVDTLEAAIWCFCTTDSYAACVLKAVNLGDDTDTVAAVAGGLAGIFYGTDAIPHAWQEAIVKRDDIETRIAQFATLCV